MTSSRAPTLRVRQRAPSAADASWATLFRWGGVAGVLFVVLVVIPLVLLATAPVPPVEGGPLLTYIADHRAVYLTQLICFVGLSVPALVVFTAVAVALKGVDKITALVGGLLGVGSEVIALSLGSSPQSLHGGLVGLSDSYVSATTDVERAGLAAAAEALIAATNAVSWAGVLTAAAILVLSALMGRSEFGRALAVIGVLTGAVGIVSEALRPAIGPAYLLYGLLLPLWFALTARALLRLARRSASA
ncbi:MAG TPA: hypothetical protein VFL94_16915 [Actinomycetales bacterium]|nr:hypothetical protein [Actinomycetales bacterium]